MYKVHIIALILLTTAHVSAQIPRPPESIRIPVMPFDEQLYNNAVSLSDDRLPLSLMLDDFKVTIGRTTLGEVLQELQTKTPLYDGRGYYQCYSIPSYSQQLWFVTKGDDLNNKISEMVVRIGDTLPADYCPLITLKSHPKFSNNIRLGTNAEIVPPLLGKPMYQNRTTNVYLYQLSQLEKLKVQIQRGKKGVEMVKVTEQE